MARAQLAARYWRALSFNIIVTSFLTSFLLPYATTMASGAGDDGAVGTQQGQQRQHTPTGGEGAFQQLGGIPTPGNQPT